MIRRGLVIGGSLNRAVLRMMVELVSHLQLEVRVVTVQCHGVLALVEVLGSVLRTKLVLLEMLGPSVIYLLLAR